MYAISDKRFEQTDYQNNIAKKIQQKTMEYSEIAAT